VPGSRGSGRHRIPSRAAACSVGTVGSNPSSRASEPSMRPAHGLTSGSAEPSIGPPAYRAMS